MEIRQLEFETNMFEVLKAATVFEDIGRGRKGAVVVEAVDAANGIPIVRTTTCYKNPVRPFATPHKQIIAATSLPINNIMIELYDPSYKTMGFHTDQSLDLAPGSHIAIYSCYADPGAKPRILVVKNKETGYIQEIPLVHNSIVTFSTETNSRHVHKIVGGDCDSEWLGMTMRLSHTVVKHIDGAVLLPDGRQLRLATGTKKALMYKYKGEENLVSDYVYPDIDFTISESDLFSFPDSHAP